MRSHTLTFTLVLTILGTSQLISALPTPKKILSTRWRSSPGEANTATGGLAPGGSVDGDCSGDDDGNCTGALINLFSNNAGDGGDASSGDAQGGANGGDGSDGTDGSDGGGRGRKHSKSFGSARSGAGGMANGGSVNGAGGLINISSNNAGDGGDASSGDSLSGGVN